VEREPPRRLSYALLSGEPLRDYRAVVELMPDGSGTRIRWGATFVAERPGTGWLYRLALGQVFRRTVAELPAAAPHQAWGWGPSSRRARPISSPDGAQISMMRRGVGVPWILRQYSA
jgi:hypothetical protein